MTVINLLEKVGHVFEFDTRKNNSSDKIEHCQESNYAVSFLLKRRRINLSIIGPWQANRLFERNEAQGR
ncbi:hypothetical protein [Staphylococcus aureus]|uniref:hypothetical protein n=1 Tax=Staphylococcus aureus TaxID=1280 RepID=UPI0034A0A2A6